MNDLLIRGVRVMDAEGAWEGSVLVRQGAIAALGRGLSCPGCPVLEGEGRTLLPAFVDLHAHFRDPGSPEKEDVQTGSWAAAHGGFTAVSVMANTDPVCDTPEVARYVTDRARKVGVVEVYPVGAVTRGLQGEELVDFPALAPHVWAFSDDGHGVERAGLVERAMRALAALGKPILCHPESAGVERELGEELMASRDLLLARATGARLHLQHLSSPGSLAHLALAKADGVPVTAEATPHHLCLCREEGDYRVNPPLPKRSARDALTQALKAGLFDAVATDHAPHTPAAKAQGAPGISGLETAFPLLYTRLVRCGVLSLAALSRLLSWGPARIMGLRKGLVGVGYDGDLVLVEDEEFRVDEGFFLSKSTNTPLLGERLVGRIWATVHRGEVVFFEGKVKGRDFDDHRQVVRAG